MNVFIDDHFIKAVKKLLKNKSHKDCEKALIKDLFNKDFDYIKKHCLARKLYGSNDKPIAKIRISYNSGKSAGYRLILMIFISDKNIYLGYVYPKTGNSKNKRKSLDKDKEQPQIIKRLVTNIAERKYREVYIINEKVCYKSNNKEVWK